MKINKGYCFGCGEPVDLDDWDEIAPGTQVWICSSSECHKELQKEQRANYEQAREEALEQFEDEWNF